MSTYLKTKSTNYIKYVLTSIFISIIIFCIIQSIRINFNEIISLKNKL